MKKLLIGAFAVLALATSSLTLAQTYSSTGTQTTQGSSMQGSSMQGASMGQSMKMDTQKQGVEKKVVKVEITGTKANGEQLAKTDITIDKEVVAGRHFSLESNHPIIEALKSRCENNNAREFFAGKGGKPRTLHLIQVKVKDGKCESATLS
jgi:type IV secretory pathway TrbL component